MTRSIAPDELHALRQILLPEVMDMCGARPDPQDRKRWLTVQGKVSVNGLQFMNWNRGRG